MGLSVSNHRVRTGLISVFTTIIGSCVVQCKLYTVDQENFTVNYFMVDKQRQFNTRKIELHGKLFWHLGYGTANGSNINGSFINDSKTAFKR